MRAFSLYLAEIVLGGARATPPAGSGEPAAELAPLDATTLAAWRAWAQRTSGIPEPIHPAGDPPSAVRRTLRPSHP